MFCLLKISLLWLECFSLVRWVRYWHDVMGTFFSSGRYLCYMYIRTCRQCHLRAILCYIRVRVQWMLSKSHRLQWPKNPKDSKPRATSSCLCLWYTYSSSFEHGSNSTSGVDKEDSCHSTACTSYEPESSNSWVWNYRDSSFTLFMTVRASLIEKGAHCSAILLQLIQGGLSDHFIFLDATSGYFFFVHFCTWDWLKSHL